MIDQGALWRVRDGKKIDVWEEKWLRKPPVYKAQQPNANQPIPLTVDKLIDEGRRVWNMITVKEMLNDQDAALVEKIPLSRINTPDKLI